MADESPLNTFNLQVTLPIIEDVVSPPISFKIAFNCHGVAFQSPLLTSVEAALEWAQDDLEEFGTWSVEGNILYLADSLCGVGSIGVIEFPT